MGSDNWDPMDYGREFDFEKGFFEQMDSLIRKVPNRSLYRDTISENCEYTNQVYECKNSYLIFSCQKAEDCAYGKRIIEAQNCIDTILITNSSNCYECINISNSQNIFFSKSIDNSQNIWFSERCEGCEECILCANIRNKKYCIENKEYSPEEYKEKKIEYLKLGMKKMKDLYESKW